MRRKGLLRVASILMVVFLLHLTCFVLTAYAAENSDFLTKPTFTHDVAIVFDNSGSMYENESWCQALYAMEVFASMLDYNNGDKLGIYPMGEIRIGKSGSPISERMDISSADDIQNIEHIYSATTSKTILKPAYTASAYLKNSTADEKWLIVLTDGKFYHDDKIISPEPNDPLSDEWLKERLFSFATENNINVQYLGFAEASKIPSNESANFYSTNAKTPEELTSELVKICNKIFQRNEITNVSGDGSFSIDVSMNSVIAFVQGKGAKIDSLLDSSGEQINMVMDTKLEAGKEGTGNSQFPAPVADLSGQVVTFDECASGSYTLNYSGSDLQIFYEPNVVVKTILLDANKEPVDFSESVLPGDYTLSYGLADATTGEDVTDSVLLKPVSLNATVTNKGETKEISSGGTVNLQPDSETVIDISGTYLKNYHISNSMDGEAFLIDVRPPDIGEDDLKVKVTVENLDFGHKWYKYSNYENWKPIRVDVTYQDKPISDEQLESAAVFSISPENKNMPYIVEPLYGESAYNVYIGKDENGEYQKPDSGGFTLTADVSIVDEYDRTISARGSDSFEVHAYSSIWRWLVWLVLLAALVTLTVFILTRKAWPHKMQFFEKDGNGIITKKKSISIGSSMTLVPVFNALSVNARKNTTVIKKFGKNANIFVEDVRKVQPNVEEFHINFIAYERANDFCDTNGEPFKGIVGNNAQIKIVYNNGQNELNGEIKIN